MPRKKKKYHFIYKITNLINKKYYIGIHSTHNIDDGYMGSGLRIKRSIKKYGEENHKLEILEFLSNREKLKEREKQIVNEDILKDDMCMNLQIGGGGGFSSEEHKLKFHQAGGRKVLRMLSIRHNERMKNDGEYREKVISKLKGNKSFLNKTHSKETKDLMSKKKKGTNCGELNSQYGTCWITNGIENKKNKKDDKIPDGWKLGRNI